MAVFFNGRLLITPTVASVVDDSAMFNPNLDVGNILALIGTSIGGAPNTPLTFGSPDEAAAALIGGDLYDAATRAFDPSAETVGPATIVCMRVNPATQSTLSLRDVGSNSVIDLTSTDYGKYTAQIKVKVETGSTVGLKLSTQIGQTLYVQDNVARNALTVQYTGGQASATITVNNNQVILNAPNGTAVATIALTTYPTVAQLSDVINTVSGFTSSVAAGSENTPSLNGLDSITSQDCKSIAFTVGANLQAAIDWFNSASEGIVTAVRHAAAGAVPVTLPFTYLTGGSDGVTTNTQWANGFTTLQSSDVQWVVPLSSSASIHAMADAHCAFMSTIGAMERRAICGMATGSTDAQAIAEAMTLDSDRTSLVHVGIYDYDVTGNLFLYQPYLLAAMIGAAFSGVNPGTAMTNKTLRVRGVERVIRVPTDTDPLILAGVMPFAATRKGFKVIKSITTWLQNRNFNRVEVSCGAALDFTVRNVRDALDDIKGMKGNPTTLALAITKAETALRALSVPEPIGPGVLVGDKASPPYKNLVAVLNGDVVGVRFQCSPVIPVNYVLVTVFAVPFSGSATAQ